MRVAFCAHCCVSVVKAGGKREMKAMSGEGGEGWRGEGDIVVY